AASRPSPPPSFNVSVFETKDQSQSDDDESNHAQDKPSVCKLGNLNESQ
ncbi:unnamed protein product, partial [Rotaria socialis]